jgi:plasmid stabilization system protein ParE
VKVRFSPRARQRARLVTTWWRANRPSAPDLLEQELGRATRQLAEKPDLGLVYQTARGKLIRRLLLPKTEQHVYYSVDDDSRTIVIQTIWGLAVAEVQDCRAHP